MYCYVLRVDQKCWPRGATQPCMIWLENNVTFHINLYIWINCFFAFSLVIFMLDTMLAITTSESFSPFWINYLPGGLVWPQLQLTLITECSQGSHHETSCIVFGWHSASSLGSPPLAPTPDDRPTHTVLCDTGVTSPSAPVVDHFFLFKLFFSRQIRRDTRSGFLCILICPLSWTLHGTSSFPYPSLVRAPSHNTQPLALTGAEVLSATEFLNFLKEIDIFYKYFKLIRQKTL